MATEQQLPAVSRDRNRAKLLHKISREGPSLHRQHLQICHVFSEDPYRLLRINGTSPAADENEVAKEAMIVNAYPPRESARRKSRTSKYGTWRSCNLTNIEEHVEGLAPSIMTYRTDYTYKPSSTRETGQLNKLGLMEYCLYPNGENDTSLCFIYVKRDKKSRGKSDGVDKMQTEEEEPPAAHLEAYTFPQQIADANAKVTIIDPVLVGASSSTTPLRLYSFEDEDVLIAKNEPISSAKALEFQGLGDDDAKLEDDWEKLKVQKQMEMEAYSKVTFEVTGAIVGSSSTTVPRNYFLEDGVVVTAKNESIGLGDGAEFWNDWEILSVSKQMEEEEEEEDMMEMSPYPPPVAPQETYTIGTEDANATVAGLNYSLEDELTSSGEALAPNCLEHDQELWDGWKEFVVVDQMEMEEEQHIMEASPYPPSGVIHEGYSNLRWYDFEDNMGTIDYASFGSTDSVPRQMAMAANSGLPPITTDFHPPPSQADWIVPFSENYFNLGGYCCGNNMHTLDFTGFDFTNIVPGQVEMAAKPANPFRIPLAFAEEDEPVNATAFDPLPFEEAFQGWAIPPTEDHFSLGLDGVGYNMHRLEFAGSYFTDEVLKDAFHDQFIDPSSPLGDGQYQICGYGI